MDNRRRTPNPDLNHPGEPSDDRYVELETTAWRPAGEQRGDNFQTETQGISGVEFDTKLSETYVGLDEFSRKVEPKGRTKSGQVAASKTSRRVIRLLCCFIFITLIALITGLGGLGIALYNFLPAFISDFVPQNNSATAGGGIADLQAQIRILKASVGQISTTIEGLQQILAAGRNEASRIDELVILVNNLSVIVEEIVTDPSATTTATATTTTATTTTAATTTTTTFQEIDLYQNCTMTQLASCPVHITQQVPSHDFCNTPAVPLNVTGMYNLDLHCSLTGTRNETNPLVTLKVDETSGTVRCLCYVFVNSIDMYPLQSSVECALYGTQCPTSFYLN